YRIIMIFVLGGAFANNALASCAPPPPGGCQMPTAPLAFLGTVVSKQTVDLYQAVSPSTNSGRRLAGDPQPPRDESYTAVSFKVIESLRGSSGNTILVRTGPPNSSASYPFEVGQDYLVFADMQNGNLYTDACLGTRP